MSDHHADRGLDLLRSGTQQGTVHSGRSDGTCDMRAESENKPITYKLQPSRILYTVTAQRLFVPTALVPRPRTVHNMINLVGLQAEYLSKATSDFIHQNHGQCSLVTIVS